MKLNNKISKKKQFLFSVARGYLLLLFASYYILLRSINKPLDKFLIKYFNEIFSIKNVVKFLHLNFFELFFRHVEFKLLFNFFYFCKYYKIFFIYIYNFIIFYKLYNNFVILHFEDIKYEEDLFRVPKDKWDKIRKINFDYFNNLFYEVLFQKAFFSFCILEFYLYFKSLFLNKFSSKFFFKKSLRLLIFQANKKYVVPLNIFKFELLNLKIFTLNYPYLYFLL